MLPDLWSRKPPNIYCIIFLYQNFPLQYSCLENPMDGGAWQAAVHGVAKSQTRLSDFTFTFHFPALEKEMASHSSVLALENPRDSGAWWAAIYGVAQSRKRLKRLSSSSSSKLVCRPINLFHVTSGFCIIFRKISSLMYLCMSEPKLSSVCKENNPSSKGYCKDFLRQFSKESAQYSLMIITIDIEYISLYLI